MAESIKSFIDRLQSDGVEAGQAQAAAIVAEAKSSAEQIVSQAQAQAAKIVAEAERQAADQVSRTRTELELASRDTVSQLQSSLGAVLRAVLRRQVLTALGSSEFIGSLIRDVVMTDVKADVECRRDIDVRVSSAMQSELAKWAVDQLHAEIEGSKATGDLKGTLKSAGFEISASEGTLEVTGDSVVELLTGLVQPALRELVSGAGKRG